MKKLLSLTLALVTLLSFATLSAGAVNADVADTSANYLVSTKEYETITTANAKVYGFIGDTDGDKEVSVMDATKIQLYMAKLATLNSTATLLADTDRDGEVSVIDATAIQLYMAKLSKNSYIAHTLYEIVSSTISATEAQKQVVNYIKANGKFDADLNWYTIYEDDYDSGISTGLIYSVDDNEIHIACDTYADTSTVHTFISVKLDKTTEYDYNSILAYKYDNEYNNVYQLFGKANQLKATDRKLQITSLSFDTETSLTFADAEPEIQNTIAQGFAFIENNSNGQITNLYAIFA